MRPSETKRSRPQPKSSASLVVRGRTVDPSCRIASADGSTPSIADQIAAILDEDRPRIDLLVVSHAHMDHIGALPAMVRDEALDIEWALVSDPELSWGRGLGEDRPAVDGPAAAVLAALREEPLAASASDALIDSWLADSATLDVTYADMLGRLEDGGTKVVRYGRQNAAPLRTALADLSLEVFGPSQDQLLACAQAMAERMAEDAAFIEDAMAADDGISPIELYRRAIGGSGLDAASDRPGTFVNLQSIVLALGPKGSRLLFTGDMQLAAPGTRDEIILRELGRLRGRLRKRRFGFVKLPHHGSHNGFDSLIASDVGKPAAFGIIGGSDGKGHPSKSVLDLLASSGIPFVRTDRNGRSDVMLEGSQAALKVARGVLSDRTPNEPSDRALAPTRPTPPVMVAPAAPKMSPPANPAEVVTRSDGSEVRVEVRIPHVTTTVRLTVEVQPGQLRGPQDPLSLAEPTQASGAAVPRLLYVTEPVALRRNVGEADAAAVIADLSARPGRLLQLDPGSKIESAVAATRRVLAGVPDLVGVVLVGGYDVVPSQAVDTVPRALQGNIRRGRDGDGFVVWSDTNYGWTTDRRQLPISRVPDGRLGSFLRDTLRPRAAAVSAPSGIRNIARPFAEGIFDLVRADRDLWVSEDATPDVVGAGLGGSLIYLMLHGSRVDGTRLWGERSSQPFEAVRLTNIAPMDGAVVFMGACWGGLVADLRAIDYRDGTPVPPRSPDNSIALACLANGARAVIGCTGSHYSPLQPPYDYFGGPIHRDFVQAIKSGLPPAEALLHAKQAYAARMPHGLTDPDDAAIEYKTIWQFTCLGLGW